MIDDLAAWESHDFVPNIPGSESGFGPPGGVEYMLQRRLGGHRTAGNVSYVYGVHLGRAVCAFAFSRDLKTYPALVLEPCIPGGRLSVMVDCNRLGSIMLGA